MAGHSVVEESLENSDEEAEDEDEEFDEEEEAHIVSASEDEDEGEEGSNALQELESFVTGLDAGQKRKAPDEDDAVADGADSKRARKRRLLPELTEAGAENEFAAVLGSSVTRIH